MKKSFKKFFVFISACSFLAACLALVWAALLFFELQPPQVKLQMDGNRVGRQKVLHLSAADEKRGLRTISLSLLQDGRRSSLVDERLPFGGLLHGGSTSSKTVSLELDPRKLGFKNGPAKLEATVVDYSFSRWGSGNTATLSLDIIIDLIPPEITLLSATRYLNQGGAGIAVYKISKEVSAQGVLAGSRFFAGCPVPGRPDVYQALFALPHDTTDITLLVRAQDPAGNTAQTRFPFTIKNKRFRSDIISLSDSFLLTLSAKAEQFFPEFLDSASPLNTFLAVNTILRSRNEQELSRLCSAVSAAQLWTGAFIPLPNASTRAVFGDQRSYMRDKNKISTSVHFGLDLASLDQAPVPAANSGRVVEIKNMGIYGLTLILDHGQGLYSTYSHLSAASVEKGALVDAGQTIARTGASGLALGDHLHFGIMIQGVFVNPVEWIDPGWIKKKIDLPLAEAFSK